MRTKPLLFLILVIIQISCIQTKKKVGMALAGKDTGGSQYFITHLATPHLNHQYTIFAEVTQGMDVIARLCQYDKITEILLW